LQIFYNYHVLSVIILVGLTFSLYQPVLSYGELQSNTINEELDKIKNGLTIQKFVKLLPEEQKEIIQNSSPQVKKELEDIFRESLPKITSENIVKKTGFFHGIGNHQAKGHVEVILRDSLPYLLLEDIEISYAGFEKDPELHVYLTRDGDINTGVDLGILQTDPLQLQYRLSGIDIQNFNTVEIVDVHTEKSYASSTLRPTYDIFTIITNYFLQNTVKDPKMSTDMIQKKSGYFKNVNAQSSKGIVKLYQTNESLLLSLSNFEILYDKENYVNLNNSNLFLTEPDPHVYLTTKDQSNSIYLGKLGTNISTLQYQEIAGKNNNTIGYDRVVIFDETTKKTLVVSDLDTPWLFETSPFLFLEWLVLFLPSSPLLIVLVMIFPLTFDYFRIIGKIVIVSLVTLKNRKKVRKRSLSKPKITIMIPAHNEEAGISESIESAISVDYPNKEIIVIDDGSTDQTYKIAREFYDKGLIKLVHRDEASGSKATALNYGSNYATGELILCMDGDTKLDRQSLTYLSQYFDDENVVAVSGNVKIIGGDPDVGNKPVHNILTKLQSYEYLIAMEMGRRFMTILNMVLIISGAFGIFRKRDFNSIGMYDKDNITEDFDLTLKIKKSKGRIEFVDDAIAWTYCPSNFRSWIKQRTRWAYGQMQTLRKHGDVLQNRRFGKTYVVAIADMWLLDICLNFLFVFYLIGITIALSFNLINVEFFVNIIVLVTVVYFIMEAMIFLLASTISGQTSKKLIYLAPVMAVFYRPLLRLIVFNAYLRALLRKKITWG
jgi:cellulose synthase/poly-beta-1,6-N-acetylglucosamine synthase-like glycosyltransferase